MNNAFKHQMRGRMSKSQARLAKRIYTSVHPIITSFNSPGNNTDIPDDFGVVGYKNFGPVLVSENENGNKEYLSRMKNPKIKMLPFPISLQKTA